MEKAANAGDKYIAGVQEAYQSGKWQAGLRSVSLAQWKQQTSTAGADRFVAGADKASTNYKAFADKFFPFVKQVQDEIDAMESTTLDQNIARMTYNVRKLATFRYR